MAKQRKALNLDRFDCECGATIYFTSINHVVKAWAKCHKPHMAKYLKYRIAVREAKP